MPTYTFVVLTSFLYSFSLGCLSSLLVLRHVVLDLTSINACSTLGLLVFGSNALGALNFGPSFRGFGVIDGFLALSRCIQLGFECDSV